MFSTSDTIVAIATPAGRGGLGVVRLSGSDAPRIAGVLVGRTAAFKPRHATFARFQPSDGRQAVPFRQELPSRQVLPGDHVVVTVFPAPASYTGEDVAEISAHGSPVVLAAILRGAVEAGARLAEPGEFTLRAFLQGKLDLIQAEAVGDLIDAVTPLQARAAFDQLEGTLTRSIGAIEGELFDITARLEASLDFPDEGYHFVEPRAAVASLGHVGVRLDTLLAQASRGRLVREGAQVAIVGAPNVGKSSLFNALLNANRAIVSPVPGTTRDLLTERADINGLSLGLIDTAGLRETSDLVEQDGVARARDAVRVAALVLVVLDRSRPLEEDDHEVLRATAKQARVVVVNKCDLPDAWQGGDAYREESACCEEDAYRAEAKGREIPTRISLPTGVARPVDSVCVSVRTGAGLDDLIAAIGSALGAGEPLRDRPEVTNVRHGVLLERARAAVGRAVTALEGAVPEEFPLVDLQEAAQALQEITGRRTADDLLRHVFERFCIGK